MAEAAPEATLAVSSDSVAFCLSADIFLVLDVVVVFQMGLELLAAVNDFGTLSDLAGQAFLSASPCFYLVMLSVLMSFPIIFATKGLVT